MVSALIAGGWALLVAALLFLRTPRIRGQDTQIALSVTGGRFRAVVQGMGGVILVALTGLILVWIGGLLVDHGILEELAKTR